MKELDVFRYLKKYRALIAGFSILAGIVFLLVAQLRIQQYTAATVIEYTGSRAAEGLSPDNTPIDTTEIYSTNLVAQAMKALDMERHDALLMEMAEEIRGYDCVVLAQASMAHLDQRIEAVCNIPVLSSPQLCLEQIKETLESMK